MKKEITKEEGKEISKAIATTLIESVGGGFCYLNIDEILYKSVDGEWIGKRCVTNFKFQSKWKEEVADEDVEYWHKDGKDADYKEIFK